MLLRTFKIVFTFLLVTSVYSQDLIIKRDSSKVFCKIIKEDSSTIYYRDYRKKPVLEASIAKSEVIECYNHSIKEISKPKSNSINNVYRGSITNYSLKKGDTLTLTENNEVRFKGRFLAEHEIKVLMRNDTSAYRELNKSLIYNAQLYNFTDNGCDGCSSYFDWLSNISGNNFIVASTVVVATVATLGTIYGISKLRYTVKRNKYHKHLYNAVSLFNAAHRIS